MKRNQNFVVQPIGARGCSLPIVGRDENVVWESICKYEEGEKPLNQEGGVRSHRALAPERPRCIRARGNKRRKPTPSPGSPSIASSSAASWFSPRSAKLRKIPFHSSWCSQSPLPIASTSKYSTSSLTPSNCWDQTSTSNNPPPPYPWELQNVRVQTYVQRQLLLLAVLISKLPESQCFETTYFTFTA